MEGDSHSALEAVALELLVVQVAKQLAWAPPPPPVSLAVA